MFEPEKQTLRVEDDLGTKYKRAFQVGSSSEWRNSYGVHRANLEFEPPVPAEAASLRITLGRWGSVVLTV